MVASGDENDIDMEWCKDEYSFDLDSIYDESGEHQQQQQGGGDRVVGSQGAAATEEVYVKSTQDIIDMLSISSDEGEGETSIEEATDLERFMALSGEYNNLSNNNNNTHFDSQSQQQYPCRGDVMMVISGSGNGSEVPVLQGTSSSVTKEARRNTLGLNFSLLDSQEFVESGAMSMVNTPEIMRDIMELQQSFEVPVS